MQLLFGLANLNVLLISIHSRAKDCNLVHKMGSLLCLISRLNRHTGKNIQNASLGKHLCKQLAIL